MLRVRLKADGRIVEILPDGSERPVPPAFEPPRAAQPPAASAGKDNAAYEIGRASCRERV